MPLDAPRACCRDASNRKVIDVKKQTQHGVETVSTTTRCKVCFSKHYLLQVPPIEFGVHGEVLG